MELTSPENETGIGEQLTKLENSQTPEKIVNSTEYSPVENYPNEAILKLKEALSSNHWIDDKEVVAFKKGEIVLHDLSEKTLRNLIGLSEKGEAVSTGLRYVGVKTGDGRAITSDPNLLAQDFTEQKNELFNSVVGRVDVTTKTPDGVEQNYTFTLIIEGIKIDNISGSNIQTGNEIFNITIIPDSKLSLDDCLIYYDLLAENLNKDVAQKS